MGEDWGIQDFVLFSWYNNHQYPEIFLPDFFKIKKCFLSDTCMVIYAQGSNLQLHNSVLPVIKRLTHFEQDTTKNEIPKLYLANMILKF